MFQHLKLQALIDTGAGALPSSEIIEIRDHAFPQFVTASGDNINWRCRIPLVRKTCISNACITFIRLYLLSNAPCSHFIQLSMV